MNALMNTTSMSAGNCMYCGAYIGEHVTPCPKCGGNT